MRDEDERTPRPPQLVGGSAGANGDFTSLESGVQTYLWRCENCEVALPVRAPRDTYLHKCFDALIASLVAGVRARSLRSDPADREAGRQEG